MNSSFSFMTVSEIRDGINTGRITSEEVVRTMLNQIEKYNRHINAIVTFDDAAAAKQAAEADNLIKKGSATGPLHGIPITIKDFYKTAGMRSTASHKAYSNLIPDEDATVVKRLRDAGAIIFGKTNLPEMAVDCQTNSPLFGRTNNPWNLDCTSGGSSGGGAAAVASGMSYMDIGNDLMGSVRIPSHFCGIFGFIPTEKLIPNSGLLAEKPEYGTLGRMMRPGIMARSIEDIRTAFEIISGPDDKEADGISLNRLNVCGYNSEKPRIAWTGDAGGLSASEETLGALNDFTLMLSQNGCLISHIGSEDFDFAASRVVFLRIFYPVLGTRMPFVIRLLARIFGKARYLDTDLKKYLEAENKRNELISQLDRLFDRYDVLLCPVTSTPAFRHIKPDGYAGITPVYKHGIKVDGKTVNYAEANMGFTIPFSVTGNPVVTIPIGFSADGLPIGIQCIGRRYEDSKLLDIAARLSDIKGSIKHPQMEFLF